MKPQITPLDEAFLKSLCEATDRYNSLLERAWKERYKIDISIHGDSLTVHPWISIKLWKEFMELLPKEPWPDHLPGFEEITAQDPGPATFLIPTRDKAKEIQKRKLERKK